MVIPGCPFTASSASAARLPLPLGRPPRRFAARPGFRPVPLLGVLAPALLPDPGLRPGRLPRVNVPPAPADRPPTPSSAAAAASRRLYSSTSGFSSSSLLVISPRVSSRKSAILRVLTFRVAINVCSCKLAVDSEDTAPALSSKQKPCPCADTIGVIAIAGQNARIVIDTQA